MPAIKISPIAKVGGLFAATAFFLLTGCAGRQDGLMPTTQKSKKSKPPNYEWTTDHLHVGVRWQPYGLINGDAYDGSRPVIKEDSSYVQFWMSWAGAEEDPENVDYENHMSDYLKAIDDAVNQCVNQGQKVELVFWHCPAWASVSGKRGPYKAKPGEYAKFATRMARHFKGRVDSYQLYHEANLESMLEDGDIDYLMSEVFTKGGKAIRKVYNAAPSKPVLLSPGGTSPCQSCPSLAGLKGSGAVAMADFYDRVIANKEVMALMDALNINVSDHFNGYGMMDGCLISSVWDQHDMVRRKLDAHGYLSKKILAAESWIVWDKSGHAADVNGDGRTDELDAYDKTVTILGKCLERGMNTINLPWSDNESGWSMGLTKRRDYNGRVKKFAPLKVIRANDGGPDILTTKVSIKGDDDTFIVKKAESPFTVRDYINPRDPNHLHYYIWRWYGQIAGGTDEVVRHTFSGEEGNDLTIWSPGFNGKEAYKLSSWNRTQKKFTVLLYSDGANGKSWAKVTIPSTIQNGRYFNNAQSKLDFRGEGFQDGTKYIARMITKNICRKTGKDIGVFKKEYGPFLVKNGKLNADVEFMNKFTMIEFLPTNKKLKKLPKDSETE